MPDIDHIHTWRMRPKGRSWTLGVRWREGDQGAEIILDGEKINMMRMGEGCGVDAANERVLEFLAKWDF